MTSTALCHTHPWPGGAFARAEEVGDSGGVALYLALEGAAGGRFARHLNLKVCGSTLLNAIQKLSLPPMETPKILGADDFALRKGHCL